MSLAFGIRPLFLFTFAVIVASGGCAVPYQWKTKICYEGPPRPFSDVSVLLVNTRSLPVFRVRSIDDVRVPDHVEYHLLPGDHTIVTGVSRGKTTDMPMTCTLRAGHVYSLVPDVWNLSSRIYLLLGGCRIFECDWRPRLVELGRVEEFTSSQYVDPTIVEHARHPFRLEKQNTTGVDEGGTHLIVGPPLFDVSPLLVCAMPPKHWGAWPKNWREGAY